MNNKLLSKTDTIFGLLIALGFGAHFIGLIDFPWYIDWVAGLWFYTIWGFFALIHAEAMLKNGGGEWWIRWLAPLLVLFLPSDALFNVVFGTIIFREWPKLGNKEVLFSNRVQRHYSTSKKSAPKSFTKQMKAGVRWAGRLNAADPGHIK